MNQVTASALDRHRFFSGMPPEHLEALAASASEVLFPPGHRIFADGGYPGHFWLVESGQVHLDVRLPDGGLAVIGTVGIGGLLGWSWLIPGHQWAFGAVCVTEVRAVEFNVDAVRDHCAADPALGSDLTRRLFPVLAGRLQDTRARLLTRSAG